MGWILFSARRPVAEVPAPGDKVVCPIRVGGLIRKLDLLVDLGIFRREGELGLRRILLPSEGDGAIGDAVANVTAVGIAEDLQGEHQRAALAALPDSFDRKLEEATGLDVLAGDLGGDELDLAGIIVDVGGEDLVVV